MKSGVEYLCICLGFLLELLIDYLKMYIYVFLLVVLLLVKEKVINLGYDCLNWLVLLVEVYVVLLNMIKSVIYVVEFVNEL